MKIVKIGALWCPGCLILNNAINKIKKEYEEIDIIEYDYDFDEESKEYEVGDILPVLVFIKNDIEISRLIGERSYEEIKEEIEKVKNNV